jgi:hypothetical protein
MSTWVVSTQPHPLTRCRYFAHAQRASETFSALLLSKSLDKRLWSDSAYETRQIAGIGPVLAGKARPCQAGCLRRLRQPALRVLVQCALLTCTAHLLK